MRLRQCGEIGSIAAMAAPVRVSVIIPSYKSSLWLEATLESIVRQTYPAENLEILVIDDASPDDSVAVARRFLSQYSLNSRVVAREVNSGVAATRNIGWRMATGDWIQFLDQDDLLAPHKIQLQAQVAGDTSRNADVVYSNWQNFMLVDGAWQPSGVVNSPFVDDDPVLRILEQPEFGYVGPTMIRKNCLERIGGFDEKPNLGEDTDLMLRMAMAGAQFREVRSEKAAFFYRQTPNSLCRTYIKDVEAMRNLLKTIRNADEFLRRQSKDGSVSEPARNALAKRYSKFVDFFIDNDPDSFRLIMDGLRRLGLNCPLNIKTRLRALSLVIGYENAIRLRSLYHRHILQKFRS